MHISWLQQLGAVLRQRCSTAVQARCSEPFHDQAIVPGPRGIVARFVDGSEAADDIVLGCDGIHSMTRRLIDPRAPEPRYVGLVNFGGYTPDVSIAPSSGMYESLVHATRVEADAG